LLPLREAGADVSLLHEMLVAADFDVARVTLNSDAEAAALAFRACGTVQTLAAMASRGTGQLSATEHEFARRLGAAVIETEWLRDLRGDLVDGRLRLPLDAIEGAGLEPTALLADSVPDGLASLLAARKTRIADELSALSSLLTREEQSAQRQGLVLARLHERLLDRIDHRAGIARTRAEVPAWSRFWTAWRTAVRHA
jgi:phytoene/squalene synthetase